MTPIVYRMPWTSRHGHQTEQLLGREWLVTNGLGGYASGTLLGVPTRKYHGLLVAALPAPLGRMMMLNHMIEQIRLPSGKVVSLAGDPQAGIEGWEACHLESFSLEYGLPVWRHEVDGYVLEKRIVVQYRANTVYLCYRLLSGAGQLRLRLRPGLRFRPHDAPVADPLSKPYQVSAAGDRFEITGSDVPALRLYAGSAAFVLDGGSFYDVEYALERERGYAYRDVLWSPGYVRTELAAGQQVALVASTEPWDAIVGVSAEQTLEGETSRRKRLIEQAAETARTGLAAELVLAADQFVITPTTRVADAARAHAAGEEIRSVIAGYHWFTDWGRDTMISLEGLTLATGRFAEAGCILRTFSHYVRDGLIPNLFPEGEQSGLYHTADATLWFFHAIDRYVRATDDRQTLRMLIPVLRDIVDHHLRGTRFGIGVDPNDGLLRQGAEGYQLTWMDAKVGDWVVTPRRGKAVEINALWYNALRLLAGWCDAEGQPDVEPLRREAERVCRSFNERFWCGQRGFLFDVIDGPGGDDASLRPNQLFAISLPNPVLVPERWAAIVDVVERQLLTPVGLRSLAPGEPDYKPKYDGDLRARDAAYHQGTVWAWLMGPFIDAWLKTHPQQSERAGEFLRGFAAHLGEACVGSISEIFDAEAPYTPRGCVAQAWSVAEVLRCWIRQQPVAQPKP
ncbi:MAG TPA: amylo-alpha-1,6-glucosidase [Pirellulales bacterium]|nr:amylo-alpha-1,6-glucosidase [Pirellulales bacterium]